ncbi:MAG: pilus assembly protein N-terminal domain-containing protein [Cyanobacteria bacterium J06642_2]
MHKYDCRKDIQRRQLTSAFAPQLLANSKPYFIMQMGVSGRREPGMRKALQVISASLAVLLISDMAEAQQISIEANKSIGVPIRNGEASSVVIGNPNIADVAVHNENLVFITGRTFGTTNLLIYDINGKQLYSGDVVVTTSNHSVVVVNRAGENRTFDCAPNCEAILAIGDEAAYFARNFEQTEGLQRLNAAD